MRTIRLLCVGVLLALLAVAPAHAAVTTTAVTAPADGFTTTVTGTGSALGPSFTVSGTSNGTTGDVVDVYCRERADSERELGKADVQAGGGWSIVIDGTGAGHGHGYWPYAPCRVFAVPDGTAPPADLSAYASRRIAVNEVGQWKDTYNYLYDAFTLMSTSRAFDDMYSVGSCGPCDMALFDPATWTRSNWVWYGNAALYRNEKPVFGRPRAYLRVDDHNAYLPYTMSYTNVPGAIPLQVDDVAVDHVNTTEAAMRCQKTDVTDPFQNAADCQQALPLGVSVVNREAFTDDGLRATVTHTWTSTDGGTHQVDADYAQFVSDASANGVAWQMPWIDGAFHSYQDASVPAPPPGPVTLSVQSDAGTPNGSFDWPVGAMTLNPAPQTIVMTTDGTNRGMLTGYRFTVAPGRDVTITQQFDIADSLSSVQSAAATTRDALQGPSVTIAAPAAGTTIATPATRVTGTAVDNGGTPKLTVNGQAVAVAADGTFSADVPLGSGTQTITAVATDAAGNTASAMRTFTVAIPPAPDTTAPALTIRGWKSKVRLRDFRRLGVRFTVVPSETTALVSQLLATVRSATIAKAGDLVLAETRSPRGTAARRVVLKPSSRLMRAVRKGRKLTVVVNGTDAAGNVRTVRRTVRIR